MSLVRRVGFGVAGAAVVAAFVWAMLPEPEQVDIVAITVGPMEVTVAAEGKLRVRETFLVTAPIAGAAQRLPVSVGDTVERGRTVVAVIEPSEPTLLDARARAQAQAAVTEAEAAIRLAEAQLARAEAEQAYAESQLERNRALAARGTIPQRMLEDSQQRVVTAEAAVAAARSELDLHRATLARMQAQLLGPASNGAGGTEAACCVEIRAPQTGTVLSVVSASGRPVQPGEPLLAIGDLRDLEVEVDLLSTDSVRLSPGAHAYVERWGGDEVLPARVRHIEPSARTVVSALGIEEQRVRVLLDLDRLPEGVTLGDGYAVFVRAVLWSGDAVVQLPLGALFRSNGGWAVYSVRDGRARLTPVVLGRQTETMAQVVSGLEPGDRVIAYPSNRVNDGIAVVPRPAGGG
jgi:HlyD family secretion protein